MILHFDYADNGMECKGEKLIGFEIAGDDKKYYKADAKIAGNDIVVSAFEVDKPKYARYCWTNYSEVTLFGKNGIPLHRLEQVVMMGQLRPATEMKDCGKMPRLTKWRFCSIIKRYEYEFMEDLRWLKRKIL